MVLWVKVHHVVFSTFIASPKQSFKSCIIWVSAWWECPLLSLCVSKRVHALQKDPGWSTVMRYEIKRALTFHVLFSLGHALTPVSTRQARLVHMLPEHLVCSVNQSAMTGLVCSDSKHSQLKPVEKKPSHLGTPHRVVWQPPLIAYAAGWLQQVQFPIWIDNICSVSLFANSFNSWLFSLL